MKIIVANNIRIKEPDEKIKDYAEENLIIKNPDYIRNERLGYSNYKTPLYLIFYEINVYKIYLICIQKKYLKIVFLLMKKYNI